MPWHEYIRAEIVAEFAAADNRLARLEQAEVEVMFLQWDDYRQKNGRRADSIRAERWCRSRERWLCARCCDCGASLFGGYYPGVRGRIPKRCDCCQRVLIKSKWQKWYRDNRARKSA